AAQIRQVVMNLITNASEALGSEKGVIQVSVAAGDPDPDAAGARPADHLQPKYLRLEVRDSGCGMSESVQASIFDPFFTTKRAGRGLGLAAVQGIIRRHGGTIRVESTQGQGSRFEISLPCIRQVVWDGGTDQRSTGEPANVAGTVLVV